MSNVNNSEVVEFYLHTGSRVLVGKPDGTTTWYTTKKEIICYDPQECQCPRTDTPVHRVIYKDEKSTFTVYYRPLQACSRIRGMVEIDEKKATTTQFSEIIYDLPSGADVVHPSIYLRRMAVRLNKSVWVIPTSDVPWSFLDSLTEVGCDWSVRKYDVSESRQIVQHAMKSLKASIQEQMVRDQESQQEAEEIFTRENSLTTTQREKAYLVRCKQIEKRMKDLEKDLVQAAERCAINPLSMRLDVARSASAGIAEAMKQRARAYAEAAKKAAGSNDEALRILGQQAQRDQVPMEILADCHRDNGNDSVADALQEAFNEKPVVNDEELVVVPSGDDNEYKLGVD